MTTALKWLMDRPDIEDPNITMAQKFIETTGATDGTEYSHIKHYDQAKCKEFFK